MKSYSQDTIIPLMTKNMLSTLIFNSSRSSRVAIIPSNWGVPLLFERITDISRRYSENWEQIHCKSEWKSPLPMVSPRTRTVICLSRVPVDRGEIELANWTPNAISVFAEIDGLVGEGTRTGKLSFTYRRERDGSAFRQGYLRPPPGPPGRTVDTRFVFSWRHRNVTGECRQDTCGLVCFFVKCTAFARWLRVFFFFILLGHYIMYSVLHVVNKTCSAYDKTYNTGHFIASPSCSYNIIPAICRSAKLKIFEHKKKISSTLFSIRKSSKLDHFYTIIPI